MSFTLISVNDIEKSLHQMSTTIPDYSSKQWMVNHPDSHPPPIQTQIAFLQLDQDEKI